jgi:hypothetical protein
VLMLESSSVTFLPQLRGALAEACSPRLDQCLAGPGVDEAQDLCGENAR